MLKSFYWIAFTVIFLCGPIHNCDAKDNADPDQPPQEHEMIKEVLPAEPQQNDQPPPQEHGWKEEVLGQPPQEDQRIEEVLPVEAAQQDKAPKEHQRIEEVLAPPKQPEEHQRIEEVLQPPPPPPNEHERIEEVLHPPPPPPNEHERIEEVLQPPPSPPNEHERIKEVLQPPPSPPKEHQRIEEVLQPPPPPSPEEILVDHENDACHTIPNNQRKRVTMNYSRRDLSIAAETSTIHKAKLLKALKGSKQTLTESSSVTIYLTGDLGLPSYYCVQVKCAHSVVFRTDSYKEKTKVEFPKGWSYVVGPQSIRGEIAYLNVEVKHAGSDCGDLEIRKLKYKGCLLKD